MSFSDDLMSSESVQVTWCAPLHHKHFFWQRSLEILRKGKNSLLFYIFHLTLCASATLCGHSGTYFRSSISKRAFSVLIFSQMFEMIGKWKITFGLTGEVFVVSLTTLFWKSFLAQSSRVTSFSAFEANKPTINRQDWTWTKPGLTQD